MARRNPKRGLPAVLFKPVRLPKNAAEGERADRVRTAHDVRWRALFDFLGFPSGSMLYDAKSETPLDAVLRDRQLTCDLVHFLTELSMPGFHVQAPAGRKPLASAHYALRYHFEALREERPQTSERRLAESILRGMKAGKYPDLATIKIGTTKGLLRAYHNARRAYMVEVARVVQQRVDRRGRSSLLTGKPAEKRVLISLLDLGLAKLVPADPK